MLSMCYMPKVRLGHSDVHSNPQLPGLCPNRIAAFEDALAYITRHDDVWLATGREIAEYFLELILM